MARASTPASSSLVRTQLVTKVVVSRAEQWLMIGPLSVVMSCSRSGLVSPDSSEMTSGSDGGLGEEVPEALEERGVDVADVPGDRVLDRIDKAVGQPHRVALGQALPGAELVVDGLSADARRARDVRQGDRRPVLGHQQVAHAVENRIAQQHPRRLGVGDALRAPRFDSQPQR